MPNFVSWERSVLLLLRFCFCLCSIDIVLSPDLISCMFCYALIFFLTKSLVLIWCHCVSAEITYRSEFCRLGAFCAIFVAFLLLLMLYEYYSESRPNFLHVLLCVQFFLTKSLVLIWHHCVSAENCRCRILSFGRVFW